MLPTMPTIQSLPTGCRLHSPHWPVCFPLAGYRANQTGLQAEITERIFWLHRVLLLPPSQCWQQANQLQILPVTERIYRLQTGLLLPPSQCWQQAHRLQSLPVTEKIFWLHRSAAPTIPVLTAGYPVTERSAALTIPVLTAGSLVTQFTGYRENLPVREICCSHHPSADSRLTGYRVYRLQREFTG